MTTHDHSTRQGRQSSHAALPQDDSRDRDDARHHAAGRGRTTRRTKSGLSTTTTGAVPGLHCLWGLGTAFFFSLLLAAALAAPALAIGITPARGNALYTPGHDIEGRFTVLNDDPDVTYALVAAEGDLADMVLLRSPTIPLTDRGVVNYILHFPADTRPEPGEHTIRITVEPVRGDDSGLSSLTKLAHKILVTVPANGSYIMSETHVTQLQDSIIFEARTKNLGNALVETLSATFTLWDETYSTPTVTSEKTSLFPGEERVLRAALSTETLRPGIYDLRTTLTHSKGSLESSLSWQFGAPIVEFTSIPRYLLAEQISPFDMQLRNDWNTELTGVYADLTLTTPDGKVVRTSKTPAITLAPHQNTTLPAFIDMRGINATTATVDIALTYEGRIITEDVPVDVLQEYVETPTYAKSLSLALIILGVIIMNITILLLWHQRREKKQ